MNGISSSRTQTGNLHLLDANIEWFCRYKTNNYYNSRFDRIYRMAEQIFVMFEQRYGLATGYKPRYSMRFYVYSHDEHGDHIKIFNTILGVLYPATSLIYTVDADGCISNHLEPWSFTRFIKWLELFACDVVVMVYKEYYDYDKDNSSSMFGTLDPDERDIINTITRLKIDLFGRSVHIIPEFERVKYFCGTSAIINSILNPDCVWDSFDYDHNNHTDDDARIKVLKDITI